MFISTLDLFKVGIGPSSSHTMGPMTAAYQFRAFITFNYIQKITSSWQIKCILKGSLAHTGKGHATDLFMLNDDLEQKLIDWIDTKYSEK